MTTKLKRITIGGYKSFAMNHPQGVELGDINILIGANGAGKSNFVSFFKMLNSMMSGALQEYTARQGGANALLHYGAKTTSDLEVSLGFRDENAEDKTYSFRLSYAHQDTLIFTKENAIPLVWHDLPDIAGTTPSGEWHDLVDIADVSHKESILLNSSVKQSESNWLIRMTRQEYRVYRFVDTTAESHIRNTTTIDANHYLYSDGGNLAAYLLGMKSTEKYLPYYKRIVQWINNIFPQFGDFVLEPSQFYPNTTMLYWREKGNEYIFGPHQISDGTLRFMALATLLLQPPELLPGIVIIDEPELGLHPEAIGALAGMVRTASQNCQVILATQSPRLLDEFSTDDIIVAERDRRNQYSTLKRLSSEELEDWLEDYCLSELWEKNIFGGQP